MSSPFRKLIRIAVILISLLLLFNFFGYYFLRLRSEENEHLIQAVNIAGRQRTLCEMITKDVLLLAKNELSTEEAIATRVNLQLAVDVFELQNRFLKQEIPLPGIPTPPNNFEIKRLIGSMQPFSRSITATGREVVKADTGQMRLKTAAY